MRWARERLSYYEREELVLETEKMKQLIRACELELKEMEQLPPTDKTKNARRSSSSNPGPGAPLSRRQLILARNLGL